MTDFSEIKNFYRFLSPDVSFGKSKFETSLGSSIDKKKKYASDDGMKQIMDYSIQNFFPGETIKKLKSPAKPSALSEEVLKGNFNWVFQDRGAKYSEILNTAYFREEDASQNVNNYWSQVCGENPGGPPLDFSIMLLRGPFYTKALNRSNDIEFYLTAMPPIFANELRPYCDVEFQIPVLQQDFLNQTKTVNRPGLYRFLMGSGADINSLTEADKAIANVTEASVAQKGSVAPSKPRDQLDRSDQITAGNQTFFGMEMFTSPQTLVNMDSLSATAGRAVDAKPFLPPATIKSLSINIEPAGAGMYVKKSAAMTLHVHDRRRLAEFSEFVRSSNGYNEVTVWITYGMLAPRHRGENDLYAKFVNETMLQREAFMITNTDFSFTDAGGVDINLKLFTKASRSVETATITISDIDIYQRKIVSMMNALSEGMASFGGERSEKQGFTKSEIRVSQVIASAAQGSIPSFDSSSEGNKQKNELIKDIDDTIVALEKLPLYRGSDFNLQKSVALLQGLKELVEARGRISAAAKNVITRLEGLDEKADPFFPDVKMNDIEVLTKRTKPTQFKKLLTDLNGKEPITYFDENLCKLCSDRKTYVSFGKLFSTLCVPSIIRAATQEYGIVPDTNEQKPEPCPAEVQIIFYRLNNHCGPISGHNIAEFPMHIKLFSEAFASLQDAVVGGDGVSLGQMFALFNDQIQDPRQVGYGRSAFYKPFPYNPPVDNKKGASEAPKENTGTALIFRVDGDDKNKNAPEEAFSKDMLEWSKQYGKEFVPPVLNFEIEVGQASTLPGKKAEPVSNSKDLLLKLSSRAAGAYHESPITDGKSEKTIIKIHIYDSAYDISEQVTKVLRVKNSGEFIFVDPKKANDTEFLKQLNDGELPETESQLTYKLGTGKEALINYIGSVVPYLTIGTEGTLINQVTLQSNTNGLIGTIAMQGGVGKIESGLATTGLSQQAFNQPLRLFPVKMTMNTLGCTLANRGQMFFIDFDTGTTIDNSYIVTKVTHTIDSGKFTTSWDLMYSDGYSRMISGNDITSVISDVNEAAQRLKAEAEQAAAEAKNPKPKPPAPAPKRKR